jgi:hypothetical protein
MLTQPKVPVASTIKNATVKPVSESLPLNDVNGLNIAKFLQQYAGCGFELVNENINVNAETLGQVSNNNYFTRPAKRKLSINAYHMGMVLQQFGVHPQTQTPISGLAKGVVQLNFNAKVQPTNKLAEILVNIKPSIYAPCNGVPFTPTATKHNDPSKAPPQTLHCTLVPMLIGTMPKNYNSTGKLATNPNSVLVRLVSNPAPINVNAIPQIKYFKNFIKQLKG